MSKSCTKGLPNGCQIDYQIEVVSKEFENELGENEDSIVKECSQKGPKRFQLCEKEWLYGNGISFDYSI